MSSKLSMVVQPIYIKIGPVGEQDYYFTPNNHSKVSSCSMLFIKSGLISLKLNDQINFMTLLFTTHCIVMGRTTSINTFDFIAFFRINFCIKEVFKEWKKKLRLNDLSSLRHISQKRGGNIYLSSPAIHTWNRTLKLIQGSVEWSFDFGTLIKKRQHISYSKDNFYYKKE